MLLDEVVVFMTTVSLFKTFNSNGTDHWYGVFYIHQNFKLDFRVQYAKDCKANIIKNISKTVTVQVLQISLSSKKKKPL